MDVFSVIWFFTLGACIASFVNVVAWRVPRGRSILGNSHCLYCNVRLAFRDNLPVIGWLNLNGRCRNCRLPISPRYLLVELFLGGIFLLLMLVELATGGANLPSYESTAQSGIAAALMLTDPKSWLIYLFHSLLFSLLLITLLIEHDKLPVPWSIVVFGFAFTALYALVFPAVGLVPAGIELGAVIDQSLIGRTITILIGGVTGLLVGVIWICSHRSLRWNWRFMPAEVFAVGLVGICLGWQAVISMAVLGLTLKLLMGIVIRISGKQIPSGLIVFVLIATLIQICCWRFVDQLGFWPGSESTALTSLTFVAVMIVLSIGNAAIARWPIKTVVVHDS